MAEFISIADDVYNELTRIKGEESYSVVIRKLLVGRRNKENVLSFFGKGEIDIKKLKDLSVGWEKWSEKYV